MGQTTLLALRLVRLGRVDEAQLAVAPLVWGSPDDGAVRVLQAWCLYRGGHRRRAVRAARRALELRPDLDCARRLLDLVGHRAGVGSRAFEEAVEADICRTLVRV